jgi:hypothetical protein
MHVHDFELNESCDELYATGHGKLVKFEFQDPGEPRPESPALPSESS